MADAIDLSSNVSRRPGQLHREIDGRVVLMSIETGNIYELNALGRAIWSALERPVAVGALCDDLAGRTGVAIETIRRDTLAFLHQLSAHDLIAVD